MAVKSVKIKVNDIVHDRISTLSRALGIDEESVIERAVNGMWSGSSTALRTYLEKLDPSAEVFSEKGQEPAEGQESLHN